MCTEFIISPVSNGWTVTIPSLQFDESYDPSGGMMKMIPGIVKAFQGDNDLPDQEQKPEKPVIMRNKAVYVFDSIEKVLAFLAKEITDK